MLKIKASIGSQGNDNIGSYRYTDTYYIQNADGEVSVVFNTKGNKKVTWETNTNFNAGADFEFFNNRLSGSVEYFYRKTSDMLYWVTVPSSQGYSGYYGNVGDMRNSGVEFAINATAIRSHNVNWDIYLNATNYSNKIIRLPEANKKKTVEGHSGYATGNKFVGEGLSLNTFLMPKYAGVEPTTGLSMWYKDVTDEATGKVTRETTTKYSEATDYLCSVPTPILYGGFGTSISFWNFDLSVDFTYSIGGKAYDSGYASLMNVPGSQVGYNIHKDVLKGWTPENTNTDIPRFQANDQNVVSMSDRFLTNASYLNFQRAQFGYNLPKSLLSKVKINSVRFYVTADNICYWSVRKGFDPRYSFTGATSDAVCSPVRTVSGGVTITF